jgi:formate/nitrite transporter FocA (FNT family)
MASDLPSHEQDTEAESEERRSPSSKVVHDTIVKEGLEELSRPSAALAWSALAGGLSMGFSLITEAALRSALPEAPWRPLIAKLGYSIGFLIVILGRQQLFTENTLTPVLPWLEKSVPVRTTQVLRLWSVVLLGNLLGALGIGLALAHSGALTTEVRDAVRAIARETLAPGFALVVLRGVFAGWLIALLVWLLPAAETARVWVIVFITYVVGLAGFSHVIAGSVDVFTAAAAGDVSWLHALLYFTVPALVGNVLGGVTLVACLNHAQVRAGQPG